MANKYRNTHVKCAEYSRPKRRNVNNQKVYIIKIKSQPSEPSKRVSRARTSPARTSPARTSPARACPARACPARAYPPKACSAKTDPQCKQRYNSNYNYINSNNCKIKSDCSPGTDCCCPGYASNINGIVSGTNRYYNYTYKNEQYPSYSSYDY
jgi:hypothetical protein